MHSTAVIFAVLALAGMVFCESEPENTARDLECYVCMGRDSENCQGLQTKCFGFCYKVVDTTNDVIVKGCAPQATNADPQDKLSTNTEASDWIPQPKIKLYFAKKEKGEQAYVHGRARFCNTHLCNAGANCSIGVFSMVLLFLVVFVSAVRY